MKVLNLFVLFVVVFIIVVGFVFMNYGIICVFVVEINGIYVIDLVLVNVMLSVEELCVVVLIVVINMLVLLVLGGLGGCVEVDILLVGV